MLSVGILFSLINGIFPVFLLQVCVSEPSGSTLVLRQYEEVQATWP